MMRATIVAAVAVVLMASGCGAGDESPGPLTQGGSGGAGGNVGGSGGGGTGGVGGIGGVGGTGGTGGIVVPVCGDEIAEGDEACDDGAGNSDTLPDACRTDCTEAGCGDSVIDGGEACDDGNKDAGDGCSAFCQLEFRCGDGLREFTEECDGLDLADQTCSDFGHNSGALGCAVDCTFDASACATVEICDNGIDDDGDLAVDCDDDDCTGDIVACPVCGDGAINTDDEDCDGSDFGDATCTSMGFDGGSLGCNDLCVIELAACTRVEDCDTPGDEDGNGLSDCEDPACSQRFECPNCGNGIIQQGEECEGTAPAQATCENNGFDTGMMTCDDVTCQISTAHCRNYECGDGYVEGLEQCDDGNLDDGDGCTDCLIDGDTCANPLLITDLIHRDPITGIWTFSGDTSLMTRTFVAPTCNTTQAEPEAVIKFTAPTAGTYTFDMATTWDDLFYVWSGGCGVGSTEIACMDTGSQAVTLTAGQEIHIVATGYGAANGDTGPFTMTITPARVCGDGFTNHGETCDTGINVGGTGCSATCQLEPGYACDNTTCWLAECGDGVKEGLELCDDGNTTPGDGCTNCEPDGNSCAHPLVIDSTNRDPATGIWTFAGDTSLMGRSFVAPACNTSNAEPEAVIRFTAPDTGEYTIDMQTVSPYDDLFYVWDGACGVGSREIACMDTGSQTIGLRAGQVIYIVATGYGSLDDDTGPFTLTLNPISACGNGVIEGAEGCDLGDILDGDGCSSICQLELGWVCDSASCRTTTCGDLVIEGTESCEDDNNIPNDGCTNCMIDGDSCFNPWVIDATHKDPVHTIWNFSGDTSTKSRSFRAPSCNSSNAEPEAVVKFTAPGTGDYTIDMLTVSPYDDLFYVWDSTCGLGSPEIACRDGGSQTIPLTTGQDIYIVATGYGSLDGDSGPFTLNITGHICGDGVVSGDETCDFGDTTAGDGCGSTCRIEDGWECDATSCWITVCGNGTREGSEQCDDNNTVSGDGCNSNCKFEGDTCADAYALGLAYRDPATGRWTFEGDTSEMNPDYAGTCSGSTGEPDMVIAFTAQFTGSHRIDMLTTGVYDDMFYVWDGACGTGSPQLACIDSGATTQNLTAGQQIYIVATGWAVRDDDSGPFTLTIEETACGNGAITSGEVCDDGNLVAGDGCSPTCQLELGWACDTSGCWPTTCGDGNLEGAEQCDDNNTVPGDGCNANCQFEGDTCADAYPFGPSHRDPATARWTLNGNTSHMNPDFTGTCSGSGGEPDMVIAFTALHSGDHRFDMLTTGSYDDMFIVWDGACGNGSPQLACVDGGSTTQNLIAGQQIYIVAMGYGSRDDDSGPFTLIVDELVCGNGLQTAGEACDDGNVLPGDGCSETCQIEPGWACDAGGCWANICGDSRLGGTEDCDDGNTLPGDGCDDICTTEGDTCATAPDITPLLDPATGFWTFTGSTAGKTSAFSGTCDASGEPDVVVGFTAPSAGTYAIEYRLHNRDGVLYVLDGSCASGASELFCGAIEFSDEVERGVVTLTAGQTIFMVLDGRGAMGTDSGPFTLTVKPVTCGDGILAFSETCDDGNVIPGDGCDSTCTAEWSAEVEPNGTTGTANPLGHGKSGALSSAGDLDLFSVDLVAGVNYAFRTAAAPDASCDSTGTHDTTLTLRNAAGASILEDGDSGPGYCSYLEYEPTVTGRYYIEVKGWQSSTLVPSYYLYWWEL